MSQISNTFEYNGCKYEFDLRDVDDSEKLEKAMDTLRTAAKTLPKAGKLSAVYKAQCEMIRGFFDTLFGKGAGVKICGERYHVTEHYDAYKAFIDFGTPQRDNITAYNGIFAQYSNRQQRRAAATGKK